MRVRNIVIALAVFAVAFMSCTQRTIQNLQYQDVKNFRIMSLSLQPDVGMDLQFYNPNTFGVTLKEANINVFINDKAIGNTTLVNTFSVPAGDTFLMPVKLRADLSNIFANAYSLLSNREVTVRLQGNVKAGRGIYVNVPINFERKQKLNVVEFSK